MSGILAPEEVLVRCLTLAVEVEQAQHPLLYPEQ
jgi:hypothetical protein